MVFMPYRLDAKRNGIPFLTLLICLLCTFVYWQQYTADKRYFAEIEKFCLQDLSKREVAWLNRVPMDFAGNRCAVVLEAIRAAEDPPVDVPDRVPRRVLPVMREFRAETPHGAAMVPHPEPLHHFPGDQLQVAQFLQHLGLEVVGVWQVFGHIPLSRPYARTASRRLGG